MHLNRRSALRLVAAPALLGSVPAFRSSVRAEPYPAKPIRIIVPYPAGGPYDGIPRIIAQWISTQLGWSIVVDNRTGATGVIGLMAAKQAPADGHTVVVVTTSTHGSMPALKRSLAYDAVRDFAPIVLMADATLVLLVRDDLPVQSVAQLIEMMRERPAALNYSTGGHGSPHHFATITLLQRAGLPHNIAVHVPFGGLAPALTALLGGNVQFMFTSTGAATQHIAGGCLRALLTTSEAIAAPPGRADHGRGSALPTFRSSPGADSPRRRARPTPSSPAGMRSRTRLCAIPRYATR